MNINIRELFNQDGGYIPLETGGKSGNALGQIVGAAGSLVINLAAVAVFIYFLWAGMLWITAGGDKAKVETARNRIANAIIGMAIVASAFAISEIVNQFFGLNVKIPGVGL